jgi:hypothetical protein
MKRSIAIMAIALTAAAGAYSQIPSLEGFQTAFSGFTGDMAGSLALNSTIGSNWSDAYVGGFPHLGVGVTTGAAFASAASAKDLFDAMGASGLPDALKTLGVPIPAAVATLKIGLPFLPLDIGIKGGYIPSSLGDRLKSASGVGIDYSNIGIQVRYALVKQNLLLPNISIGASYNYQQGKVTAPTNIGAKDFNVTTYVGSTPTTTLISASDPALALGWKSNIFDVTAQVSKLLLFLVPYAGVGYSMGSSSVTGGVSSAVTTDYHGTPGGSNGSISDLNAYFAQYGGPTIDNQGFTYSATANKPVLRVYGGISLRIIILDIDTQAMYVPATKALGASVTARLQL